MEKPPMEWIDKLFNCMELFYGERWIGQFHKDRPESLYKTIWQSALTGCAYDDIRCALVLLKRQATRYTSMSPPGHLEFFRISNHLRKSQLEIKSCNADLAKRTIDEIREKLRN